MGEAAKKRIENVLFSDKVVEGFDELHKNGELKEILPELDATVGFVQFDKEHQSEHHHLDLYHHTLETVNNTDKNNSTLRWAALFHDFGKMANDKDGSPIRKETIDKNGVTKYQFLGHDRESEKIADDIMKRLEFNKDETELIKKLVIYHERNVNDLTNKSNKNYEKNMKNFLSDLGEDNIDLLIGIKTADINAQKPETRTKKLGELTVFKQCAKEISEKNKQNQDKPKAPQIPVTNSDIIKFIPPGPGIKEAMSYLNSIYKEGMTRDELLIAAKQELVSIAQKYPAKQPQQQSKNGPTKNNIADIKDNNQHGL